MFCGHLAIGSGLCGSRSNPVSRYIWKNITPPQIGWQAAATA